MGTPVRDAGSGGSPCVGPAHLLAQALGAHARVWFVSAPDVTAAAEMLGLDAMHVVAPLAGMPLEMRDVRQLAREHRRLGAPLALDLTLVTFFGCAGARLGADVSLASVGEGGVAEPLVAVGLSRDAWRGARGGASLVARLEAPSMEGRMPAVDALYALDARRRKAADAAQVLAAYLLCHPRVEEVRYPGLKTDPSFPVASSQLTGGFGPLVDFRLREEDGWHRVTATAEDATCQVIGLERALAHGMVRT